MTQITDGLAIMLISGALWSVLCRVNLMHHGITRPVVFLQHAGLGLGLLGGLILPADWGRVAIIGGVVVFLLCSAGRWRQGAPLGTRAAPESISEA